MNKNTLITTILAASVAAASSLSAQVYSTDFSTGNVNTTHGAGALSTLGDDGATLSNESAFAYSTWYASSGNGGVNKEGQGRKDGLNPTASSNDLDTFGQANPQSAAGTNARAAWIVFEGSNFTAGQQYKISFDVIGGTNRDGADAGDTSGRMWVAELSGIDNTGSNYVTIDGTHNGWNTNNGHVVFAASGSASVNFLTTDEVGTTPNGQNIVGENLFTGDVSSGITPTITSGASENSFTFTYTDGTDIGFAVGTYNNNYGIDNFVVEAVPEPSTFALLAGMAALGWVMIRRRG
jgi:hypothetical protein